MRPEDACYDDAYPMRARQRRARRYCLDAGGQLINSISAHDVRHSTAFFRNLRMGAGYNRTAGEWPWLNGSPQSGNVTWLGG